MRTFSVYTEYRQLHQALVCRPTNYVQTPPINDVEEYYLKYDPPTREGLVREHDAFVAKLKELGVQPVYLKAEEGMPQQMFTRDIGFTIGEHFYVSNLAKDIRKNEVEALKKYLEREGTPYRTIPEGCIEGGDVMVHAPFVFVGLSQRTDYQAVRALQEMAGKDWRVVPIQLASNVLHLDCVMSIVSEKLMIWCPDLILSNEEFLEEIFPKQISISSNEAFHLAANILMINPENALVEQRHKRLCEQLAEHGINAHGLDWNEIKKLGGLFRCASCPIA